MGWRFVNRLMKEQYGVDSMPETAENVATDYKIERASAGPHGAGQPAQGGGGAEERALRAEITPVSIAQKKGDPVIVSQDEHPRETSLESLARLKGVVRPDGSVTAGNASGVNDGSCALLVASEAAAAATA
jgi:acetyl-CoA acetyltransferase